MKNKLYYLGIFSIALLILGGLFKVQHWPGAGIVLFAGIFCMNLIFLPLAMFNSYKAGGRRKTMLYVSAYITLAVMFTSILFKVLHWPGASILLFIDMILPIVLFLPVYLYFFKKEKEESLTNFLYITFFLVGLSAMSGFLAIDISKSILADMTRITVVSDLTDYENLQASKIKSSTDAVQQIRQKTDRVLGTIREIEKELMLRSNLANKAIVDTENKDSYWYIQGNYIREAGLILFGELNKGAIIENELLHYQNFLMNLPEVKGNGHLVHIPELAHLISTDRERMTSTSWLINRGNAPLAQNIMHLVQLENAIVLAELEALALLKPDAIVDTSHTSESVKETYGEEKKL